MDKKTKATVGTLAAISVALAGGYIAWRYRYEIGAQWKKIVKGELAMNKKYKERTGVGS